MTMARDSGNGDASRSSAAVRRTAPAATTEGLFTTRKLQALLDARLNPNVGKRTQLAEAIAAAEGRAFTVHAVDAWFKRNDANLPVLKRPSLEPGHNSFPVPHSHWAALFQIFSIEMDDLAPNDLMFRGWCFRAARERHRPPTATPKAEQRVFLCCSAGAEAQMQRDAGHIRSLGYTVVMATASAPEAKALEKAEEEEEAEWSALHGLDQCAALLAILHTTDEQQFPEALQFARASQLPVVIASSAGKPAVGSWLSNCTAVQRTPHALPAYDKALANALAEVLDPARHQGHETDTRSSPPPSLWPDVQLISDRPSIAVLPFANLTGNLEHELTTDSMVDDLVSMLSRIPEFFVISRMSTQNFKHAAPDCRDVGRQLGVRYVLVGSLRGSGERLRITAQLVDASNGVPVWNGRFDRIFDDPFAVQDQLVLDICAQLEPQVRHRDIQYGSRTGDVRSWRLWQEGWYYLFVDAPTPIPQRSLDLFEQAIALDATYAPAHAGIAIALGTGMVWGGVSASNLQRAMHHAEQAYRLLPENPLSLYAMGMLSFIQPIRMETPLEYVLRAIALEPSNPMYQAICGYLQATIGNTQQGVDQCEYAMRLSPMDAREPFLCYMLGNAYVCNRQYERAIETMTRCRRFSEVDFIWIMIAFSHSQLGEPHRALACLQSIKTPRPYRLYEWSVYERMWLTTARDEKARFLALFHEAGIR